jgi:CubicO group peptidase (beta-lactamase class C family)
MKLARHALYCLLFGLLAGAAIAADLPTARPESVGMSSQRLGMLKSEMQALVDRNQLPGVLTMVAKDGKVVQFDVAGKRDLASNAPLQKDSIFRIYSMSKPITGVAMMMLFEEGKWQLNDPVSKHIPEWANLKVAKVNPQNGSVTQVAPDHAMTMRELMSHSGGLTYGVFGSTPVDKMYTDVNVLDRDATLQAMVDKLAKIPLLLQPGEKWQYSVSVDVQGYLVEKLSGQPFPEFLKQRIFDPLGMKDTAFYVPPEKMNRFVSFYTYDKDRKFVPHPGVPDFSKPPGAPSGGGGLVSTAMDYMRFCQMLLNGGELDGKRLLSPLSVQLMRSNVLPASARTMGPGTGFGLDFAVVEDPVAAGGYYGEGTFYWGGYAGTWFWIDPVNKLIVVGMIQHRGDGLPDVRALSRNLTYQAIVSDGVK